jgi:hypothetical protein
MTIPQPERGGNGERRVVVNQSLRFFRSAIPGQTPAFERGRPGGGAEAIRRLVKIGLKPKNQLDATLSLAF